MDVVDWQACAAWWDRFGFDERCASWEADRNLVQAQSGVIEWRRELANRFRVFRQRPPDPTGAVFVEFLRQVQGDIDTLAQRTMTTEATLLRLLGDLLAAPNPAVFLQAGLLVSQEANRLATELEASRLEKLALEQALAEANTQRRLLSRDLAQAHADLDEAVRAAMVIRADDERRLALGAAQNGELFAEVERLRGLLAASAAPAPPPTMLHPRPRLHPHPATVAAPPAPAPSPSDRVGTPTPASLMPAEDTSSSSGAQPQADTASAASVLPSVAQPPESSSAAAGAALASEGGTSSGGSSVLVGPGRDPPPPEPPLPPSQQQLPVVTASPPANLALPDHAAAIAAAAAVVEAAAAAAVVSAVTTIATSNAPPVAAPSDSDPVVAVVSPADAVGLVTPAAVNATLAVSAAAPGDTSSEDAAAILSAVLAAGHCVDAGTAVTAVQPVRDSEGGVADASAAPVSLSSGILTTGSPLVAALPPPARVSFFRKLLLVLIGDTDEDT